MRKRVGATLAFLLVLFFFGLCLANSKETGEQSEVSDVIIMDAMLPYGELERPQVRFPHEKHAKNGGKTACLQCHKARPDGGFSFAFKQRKGMSGTEVRDLYHAECIRCHAEAAATTKLTGPQVCGGCHVRHLTAPPSSSHNVDFDNALHSIHTDQASLDCLSCHDFLQGDSDEANDSVRIPHDLCVTCHVSTLNAEEASGPISCNACHGLPDRVSSESRVASGGGEVSFDHDLHEEADISCETCHHKEPETACSECHTDGKSAKGGGISLYTAMHTQKAEGSCIGCHDAMGAGAVDDCTGCHAPFSSTP